MEEWRLSGPWRELARVSAAWTGVATLERAEVSAAQAGLWGTRHAGCESTSLRGVGGNDVLAGRAVGRTGALAEGVLYP
jgi:hypothetical protein